MTDFFILLAVVIGCAVCAGYVAREIEKFREACNSYEDELSLSTDDSEDA